MSDTDAAPQKARLGTSLRVVLFVSLALNMFLLGAGAVIFTRFAAHPGPPLFRFQREFPGPGMILRALPDDERTRLEKEIGPKRQAMREQIASARKARREALAAFSAESYSPAAMEEKLRTSRAADLAAIGAVHDVLAEVVGDLSPEDRSLIIEVLRKHKMPDGPPPPPPDGAPPTDEPPPPP